MLAFLGMFCFSFSIEKQKQKISIRLESAEKFFAKFQGMTECRKQIKQNEWRNNTKLWKGRLMKIDCLQRSVYDKSITGFIHIIAWWNKPIIRDEMKWDLLTDWLTSSIDFS